MTKLKLKRFFLFILVFSLLSSCSQTKPAEETKQSSRHPDLVSWRNSLDDNIFKEAKEKNKAIMLNLKAVWCHWCHVMDEKTYANPEVADLLNNNFIAIKVDQDSNPYLSNKYKRYGWPATIFFSPNGEEILKKAGYIEPEKMQEILKQIIKEPNKKLFDASDKFSVAQADPLDAKLKKNLYDKFKETTDLKIGGLKLNIKNLDRDTVEYALLREYDLKKQIDSPDFLELDDSQQSAIKNELKEVQVIAKANLDGALKILDKSWGGFYQYSTFASWDHPHFEKLTERQADYLRAYAYAYLYTNDENYLEAVNKTLEYLQNFMTSPEGGFYSSMDADLKQGIKDKKYFSLSAKERKKRGIPRIDKNIYPNKNGKVIEALSVVYKLSSETRYLKQAAKAIQYLEKNLKDQTAFKHSFDDPNFYLNDNLFMARAYLALYEVTADRTYLSKSLELAGFIKNNFRDQEAGYISTKLAKAKQNLVAQKLSPQPILQENIKLAQFFNLLSHYSGQEIYHDEAKHIMKYLGSKELIESSYTEPGILIVDYEISNNPMHYTVVGSKSDQNAKALFAKALKYPSTYLRIEWYDSKEGRLVNHDTEFPDLGKAALFSCANSTCSLPIYNQ